MLLIRRPILTAMLAHAVSERPVMACGIVAGPRGSDRPERFIRMQNAEQSPTFWFDAAEQLKVYREMDKQYVQDDGDWSVRTKDGRRSAEAMHTVLVTENGPEILTEGSAR